MNVMYMNIFKYSHYYGKKGRLFVWKYELASTCNTYISYYYY